VFTLETLTSKMAVHSSRVKVKQSRILKVKANHNAPFEFCLCTLCHDWLSSAKLTKSSVCGRKL